MRAATLLVAALGALASSVGSATAAIGARGFSLRSMGHVDRVSPQQRRNALRRDKRRRYRAFETEFHRNRKHNPAGTKLALMAAEGRLSLGQPR